MGTRSLTVILDEHGHEIAVLYRQFDGYPSGHGQALVDFLRPFTLVNGLGGEKPTQQIANGLSCLAAQLVAHFKTQPGDFYLYPAGTRDAGEEWIYTVYGRGSEIHLKVSAGAVTFFGLPGTAEAHMPVLFDGLPQEFSPDTITERYAHLTIPNDYLDAQQKKKPPP